MSSIFFTPHESITLYTYEGRMNGTGFLSSSSRHPSVYIISTVCTTYVKAEASFRDEKDFLSLQEKYSGKL